MQTEDVSSRNLMPSLRHRLATLCLLEQSLKGQQAVLAKPTEICLKLAALR